MRFKFLIVAVSLIFLMSSCSRTIYKYEKVNSSGSSSGSSSAGSPGTSGKAKTFVKPLNIDRQEFVSYAKTLLGTPYKYGSAVASKGLDCSGFVYNVFQYFGVASPRVTKDFTYEGKTVSRNKARPGDIILFTGSDNSSGIVGHMGIITSNDDKLMFVHSASGKNVGVILNELKGYYETHFVKIISVLQ